MSTTAAIEVEGLRKAYDGHEAVRGIDFAYAAARCSGCSGRTARARRRRSRSSRATACAAAARCPCSATIRASGRPSCASASASCSRAAGPTRISACARRSRTGRRCIRRRATSRRSSRSPAWRRPPTAARARCRAASSGGSTWRWRWSATPSWCSSTSRPWASTRRRAARRGTRCAHCARSARRCCSPPTTSTRRRRWPTAWRSSRTARSSPRARPASWSAGRRAIA